jgi:hypothetical protein
MKPLKRAHLTIAFLLGLVLTLTIISLKRMNDEHWMDMLERRAGDVGVRPMQFSPEEAEKLFKSMRADSDSLVKAAGLNEVPAGLRFGGIGESIVDGIEDRHTSFSGTPEIILPWLFDSPGTRAFAPDLAPLKMPVDDEEEVVRACHSVQELPPGVLSAEVCVSLGGTYVEISVKRKSAL